MPASLEEQINKFETALAEMREEVRMAHEATRAARTERKELERLLQNEEIKKMVHDRVDHTVKAELDKIAPEIRSYSTKLYEHVGVEIDRLIELSLGKVGSTKVGTEDIRPKLASHLKEWLRQQIRESGSVVVMLEKDF